MASFLRILLKSFSPQAFQAASAGLALAGFVMVLGSSEAAAQASSATAPATVDSRASGEAHPPSKKPNPYGSPLDTLMSTRIWADVPPAKPFVDATRPDPKNLDYAPLTGSDPVRPKPRDPAGVAALQAELEAGGAKNAARAKGLQTPTKATRRVRKPKSEAARE